MACNTSYIFAEEELCCPICFEEYNFDDTNKYPYLLLCLHTFCSLCLKELRKEDGILECPLCRKLHNVSKIEDLMDNYAIHEYLRKKLIRDDEVLAKKLQNDEARAITFSLLNTHSPNLQKNVVGISQSLSSEIDALSFESDQEIDEEELYFSSSETMDEENVMDIQPPSTSGISILNNLHPQSIRERSNTSEGSQPLTSSSQDAVQKRKYVKKRSNTSEVSQPLTSSSRGDVPKRKYVQKKAINACQLEKNANGGTHPSANLKNVHKRKYTKKKANASNLQENNTDKSTQPLTNSSRVSVQLAVTNTAPKGKNIKKRIKPNSASVSHTFQTFSSPMSNSSFEVYINSSPRYNSMKCLLETRLSVMRKQFKENGDLSTTDVSVLLSDEADSFLQSSQSDTVELTDYNDE